jgi:hypothetical protein
MLSSVVADNSVTLALMPTPGVLPSYFSRSLLPDYPPPRA